MKANQAPDKLYLSKNIYGTYLYQVPDLGDLTAVEYTRTNAFIKNVENFLEMLGYGFTIIDNITHTIYDKEQLIKDFKNYMKGE